MKKEFFFGQKLRVLDDFQEVDDWISARRAFWLKAGTVIQFLVLLVIVYVLALIYGGNLTYTKIILLYVVLQIVLIRLLDKYCPEADDVFYEPLNIDIATGKVEFLYSASRTIPLLVVRKYISADDILETQDSSSGKFQIQAYGENEEFECLKFDSSINGIVNLANLTDEVRAFRIVEFIDLMTRVALPLIVVNQFILFDSWLAQLPTLATLLIFWYFNHEETLIEVLSGDFWEIEKIDNAKIYFAEGKISGQVKIFRKSILGNKDVSVVYDFLDSAEFFGDNEAQIAFGEKTIKINYAQK